jgi:hypothetical protein
MVNIDKKVALSWCCLFLYNQFSIFLTKGRIMSKKFNLYNNLEGFMFMWLEIAMDNLVQGVQTWSIS